ncbi:hypothetical protein ATY41_08165 [Leifsonia xyli subsp. xyli]|nr:hypothetical protein ATY41_08165 [Leifsonia xyli subsp. xyli]
MLSGCALFGAGTATTPTPTRHTTHKQSASPRAEGTPEPTAAPVPPPTLTSVAAGTVVAEGDVTSPKGSIHFRYRMLANGDNTYRAEYTGFTSTVSVPVSVTLLEIPPQVGDGMTYHGVGDQALGGPTAATRSVTASLGSVGQPSHLTTLVTYSSAASFDGVPQELGPDKVLAVNRVQCSVPVRESNVRPADNGAREGATGVFTATTGSGAPRKYTVAAADLTGNVADWFGIPLEYLIWLNPDLPSSGTSRWMFEGTELNLDPDRM